jgi:DNA-binding CsgD family transcriptional regulator
VISRGSRTAPVRPAAGSPTDALHSRSLKRAIAYGLLGGVLIALLKLVEYKHFVHAYPTEVFGGVVALVFATIGIHFGMKWAGPRRVVVREVSVGQAGFVPNDETLQALGITPREHEILGLIAAGLSNREIAGKLFVSENTVKTHASRLFQKMGVSRRTQASHKGRELGLLP